MADENEQAVTPATDDAPSAPVVLDTVIDHDAPEPAVEDKPEEKSESDEAKAEEKKKLSGAQRAKIREARLLQESAEKDRVIEELRRATAPKQPAPADIPPKEEDFNGDYFAWQRALTAHEAGKKASEAIETAFERRERAEREQQQSRAARERAVAHAERVENARDAIPDYDSVMEEMKGVTVRDELIEEIMSSDKSAEVAYYLAKNPDKLSAMNSMNARELAREMGRLEATVSLPSPKKQTNAPHPLTAVRGGAAPSSQEADLAAYLKKTYG